MFKTWSFSQAAELFVIVKNAPNFLGLKIDQILLSEGIDASDPKTWPKDVEVLLDLRAKIPSPRKNPKNEKKNHFFGRKNSKKHHHHHRNHRPHSNQHPPNSTEMTTTLSPGGFDSTKVYHDQRGSQTGLSVTIPKTDTLGLPNPKSVESTYTNDSRVARKNRFVFHKARIIMYHPSTGSKW